MGSNLTNRASRPLLGKSKAQPIFESCLAASTRSPFRTSPLTWPFSKAFLHEVPIVSQALREAGRVCRRTGKIAIVDFPAFPENWLRWSNLKWRLQRPWRIFALSPDKHAGFSRTELLSLSRGLGPFRGKIRR